ncbi:MAG: zinc-ribbon domain-containing protein [Proteobacteria bacterium]|nr:zinc-ribbon domain-containing protein [Pseudomonadota bacterium]
MIAACPKCNARYRVNPIHIGSDGARLRCARCQAVFRVRAPESAGSTAAARPAAAPIPEPAPEHDFDRTRLVVVADPEEDSGKRTAAALSEWGLQSILVHDGVEALLAIQRRLPRLVVLDAALPKMYGFQVCEIVKRNESLRSTRVVLIGAIHQSDRYRRPPSELYSADVYLEGPDLPDGLLPILRQAGFPLVESAAAAPAPVAPPQPAVAVPAAPPIQAPAQAAPVAIQAPAQAAPVAAPIEAPAQAELVTPEAAAPAAAPVVADDPLAAERSKAERLARIIVSDIILYSPEKFDAAIAAGNVVEALDSDLDEGRSLFQQRIDPRVRDERNFLVEELIRVAREKGMQ